jgi:hypothetical protein
VDSTTTGSDRSPSSGGEPASSGRHDGTSIPPSAPSNGRTDGGRVETGTLLLALVGAVATVLAGVGVLQYLLDGGVGGLARNVTLAVLVVAFGVALRRRWADEL